MQQTHQTRKKIYYENLKSKVNLKIIETLKNELKPSDFEVSSVSQGFQLVTELKFANAINQQIKIKPIILCRKQIKQKKCKWKK